MKKIFLLAAAAATLVMASCSKEAGNKVFKAEAEPAVESGKVAYSGGSLLWQAGDEVSIYDGSSHSAVYAVSEGAGTSHCEFAFSSGSELDEGYYTAVSPAAIRTGESTVSLPASLPRRLIAAWQGGRPAPWCCLRAASFTPPMRRI